MEQFTLKWTNYHNQISDSFGSLLDEEDLVDVTLSCEGKKIKAHRVLLSACSPYFRDVFKENPCQHPVIVFRNVPFMDLSAIVEFIYKGEVSVVQEQLTSFLSTAEMLEIKGLTDEDSSLQDTITSIQQEPVKPQPSRPVEKRKTSDTLLPSKKASSPPLKKRKPENVGKPPVKVMKVEVEVKNEEEDLNLDQSGDNEEEVEEFVQNQNEEEPNQVEEATTDSEPLPAEDTVADEEMQAEESQPSTEKFEHLFDLKKEEEAAPVAAETVEKKPLKSILKAPKQEEEKEPIKKSVQTKKPAVSKPSKPVQKEKEVNLPKGLTVVVRPVLKEQNLNEPVYAEEEAKTPMEEDVPTEEEPEPEEPQEPEFDYYGCEVCKTEARPVADKLLLTHKCPICPCACFCAHLLKEHMRVIHGWFNVQRRFNSSF